MTIDRVEQLDAGRFLDEYVLRNRPVVVTDALSSWRLDEVWTPSYLSERFGQQAVQVYNSYFDLTSLSSLNDYLRGHFGRPRASGAVPYVRWYTKLRDSNFAWADEVFRALRANWDRPYFVPSTDYLLPFAPLPKTVNPAEDAFPARGLFISGQGARTGLHVDPWGSDAILCQVYGTKTWLMYGPDQSQYVRSGSRLVDPDEPNLEIFPAFRHARPAYEFTIAPGDTVYVPHGWFHHVRTETDSISLTWNFVHASTADALIGWLDGDPSDGDLGVLGYFLRDIVPAGASAREIKTAVLRQTAGDRRTSVPG